jgi:hypothetical protein
MVRSLVRRRGVHEAAVASHPFGKVPWADRETYLRLHRQARAVGYPAIDAFEQEAGFAIDRLWLEDLALHTQIVIKESRLNYQHGRVLYAAARRYLAGAGADGAVTILETGTARGFSALCLARALNDAGPVCGHVVTVDPLPHDRRMIWNCIDDHDGPMSRQELLARWPQEVERVVFLRGTSGDQLDRLGLARVGIAFLDANHAFEDVMSEYRFVRARQRPGDLIVFDDVTPGQFDGVVAAVAAIEREGLYHVSYLRSASDRGYAFAVRS